MNVFLTGGSGYIGSAVLKLLTERGHRVTALVRSDASAQAVTQAGAIAVLGDLTDSDWLAARFADADAAIHLASPGDATSAMVDTSAARAAVSAFTGTDKPYVHTGGIWVYGSGSAITETLPYDPPALTGWRDEVERIVLDADGLRAILIVPAVVHGHGKGIPLVFPTAPRDDTGALHLVGDGEQHWTTVHVDDLADLYVRAIENPAARGRYLADDGQRPTVRELGEAASRAAGQGGAVRPESVQESRDRLGELFADALLLDQQVVSTKAADELGWKPTSVALVDDLATGTYAHPAT